MESRAINLQEVRADKMLKEYVRIRYEMAGEERIGALIEWAANVDKIYVAANEQAP